MSVRPIKCPDISLKCHPRVSTEGKVSVKDFSFRESDRHCGRPDLWTPRSQPGSLIYHGVPLSQREKIPCPRIFVQRFQFWQSVQRLLRYSSLDQSSRPDNQHWSAVMIEHGWILGFLSLFNLVASRGFCKALFNIVLIHINSTKAEKYYNLDT